MTARYLDGERVAPTSDGRLAEAWPETLGRYRERIDAYLLHDALAELWGFVGATNRFVDSAQPWVLAKAARDGDTAAEGTLRGVLGDLLESCRLVSLAVAPFMPTAAPRAIAQLGIEYPYGPDGNGGPPLDELLRWGSVVHTGRIGAPEPLFPRLDIEPVDVGSAEDRSS
jgi:methionyl-tRNA synthetase